MFGAVFGCRAVARSWWWLWGDEFVGGDGCAVCEGVVVLEDSEELDWQE